MRELTAQASEIAREQSVFLQAAWELLDNVTAALHYPPRALEMLVAVAKNPGAYEKNLISVGAGWELGDIVKTSNKTLAIANTDTQEGVLVIEFMQNGRISTTEAEDETRHALQARMRRTHTESGMLHAESAAGQAHTLDLPFKTMRMAVVSPVEFMVATRDISPQSFLDSQNTLTVAEFFDPHSGKRQVKVASNIQPYKGDVMQPISVDQNTFHAISSALTEQSLIPNENS